MKYCIRKKFFNNQHLYIINDNNIDRPAYQRIETNIFNNINIKLFDSIDECNEFIAIYTARNEATTKLLEIISQDELMIEGIIK